MIIRAIWNGQVIAESDETIIVESNHYFPRESLIEECFIKSSVTSTCGWKGEANYLSIVIDEKINENTAWYYKDPKIEAIEIKGKVAFWKGVTIE